MPFTFRKRIALVKGVLFLNLSRGEPSLTLKLGRLSINSRTRKWSVDLPGPVNYRSGGAR